MTEIRTWEVGDIRESAPADRQMPRIGLGIDAGGTYTDAVLFEFPTETILASSKALTTKWKYSKGIMEAVEMLPADILGRTGLVSVSTTLVTNAIVESASRPVGLLLMPSGRDTPIGLAHDPTRVIRGRMSIAGEVLQDIDENEIVASVQEMITRFHVEAFAVSGYGGSVNPKLELAVKSAVRRETGLEVCCGHELSGILNFPVRAATAVLNAGVMPIMEDFLLEMENSMEQIGIQAPLLVVRGDGSVMSESYAREYPVQSALSGPAASMAGARFLTGSEEALVIDVGGTTSDIGFLKKGRVDICEEGSRIGVWDTHIRAVDMLTAGLGGDSEILLERQTWSIGPRRVAPVSSLGIEGDSISGAMEQPQEWADSTAALQYLTLTGKEPDFKLTAREQGIYDALTGGPLQVHELKELLGIGSWKRVTSGRLEAANCVQRAGLTPTDLFHTEGTLTLWNSGSAKHYLELIAAVAGMSSEALRKHIHEMILTEMGNALLTRLMALEFSPSDGRTISAFILDRGNSNMEIQPRITVPVVGLGAPATLMCAPVMKRLGADFRVPDGAEVANAVGAVSSDVRVLRSAGISATNQGGFRIRGLDGNQSHFEGIDEAEECCVAILVDDVRRHARNAGTSERRVIITATSESARSADGSELVLGRSYQAEVSGPPDLIES